jgi:opacity protein-like surface antigen
MKRLKMLIGLLLWLFSFTAVAYQNHWIDNWLVGISGGYADRNGALTVMSTNNVLFTINENTFPSHSTTYSRNLSDNGFIWGILVGYQAICHQWLVGIELNADRQSISQEHEFAFIDADHFLAWNGSARYQRKMMAGLTGRIGYAVRTNFMPYLRGGVELGDDRLKTFYYSPLVQEGLPAFNEQNQWVYRFLLGAGVEFPIFPACGFTLRVEYDYHSKGKTLQTSATVFDGGFGYLFASQSQPQTQSARMTLVWNFF